MEKKTPPPLHFFIPCELPRSTHQSGNTILKTKEGRYFVGKNQKGKATAKYLRAILSVFKPTFPIAGAIRVEIEYYMPYLKSATKAQKQIDPLPNPKRPDCDNLAKGVLDAMQAAGYFYDDAQVYSLQITKAFSHKPGLGVKIQKE